MAASVMHAEQSEKKPTNGVFGYLLQTALPTSNKSALLKLLYADDERGRFACRAILQQQLSDVGQQIITRLAMCCGGSFPLGGDDDFPAGVRDWIKNQEELPLLLEELQQWAIIDHQSTGDTTTIALTDEFRKGLLESIQSLDSSPWHSLSQAEITALVGESDGDYCQPVSRTDIERQTQEQWETVLHFLVGTPHHSALRKKPLPDVVVQVLQNSGLMQTDPEWIIGDEKTPLVITSKGYEFLLLPTHQQMWHFVEQYLKAVERDDGLLTDALLFLVSLSFTNVGEGYSSSTLSSDQPLMRHLSLFGILHVDDLNENVSVFYPSLMALQLLVVQEPTNHGHSWSTTEVSLSEHPPRLRIIVQANFEVCAYTTSDLLISILALFCNTIRRLPNIVFMSITHQSVMRAFSRGIRANQILQFLHAHGGSSFPQNVQGQICLWDMQHHS